MKIRQCRTQTCKADITGKYASIRYCDNCRNNFTKVSSISKEEKKTQQQDKRLCLGCNACIEQRHGNSFFCETCAKIRHKEVMKKYRKNSRTKKPTKKENKIEEVKYYKCNCGLVVVTEPENGCYKCETKVKII